MDSPAHQLLVWGTLQRLLAALFFIATAQWYWQVDAFLGPRGLMPITHRLRQIRTDFPGSYALRFPSLMWLCPKYGFLKFVIVAGSLASVLTFAGAVPSWAGFATAHLCYLTISNSAFAVSNSVAMFPWDDMILEAGFLAIFLPSLPLVTQSWSATLPPLPIVAFMFRWLGFRVMMGFGKEKFAKAESDDWDYLRGFTINIPLPSFLSYLMHHSPTWFQVFSLYVLFVLEIVVPFGLFLPGWPRVLAGVGTVGLMVGIHLTGNWGHFNILTALVALSAVETASPCLPWVAASIPGGDWTGELCASLWPLLS